MSRPAVGSPLDVIRDDLHEVMRRAEDDLRWFAGKRVLVTGGAGFLMSYLVDVLAVIPGENPPHVVVVDNFTTAQRARVSHLTSHPRVELRELDVCTLEFAESFDVIVHGASIVSPVAYRRMALRTLEVNALGTWALLRAVRDRPLDAFVLLSTSEVYGDPEPAHVPTPETYPGRVSQTGPRACYGESKRFAETLALTYFHTHGTPVRIVRPFNVYGPGLRPDDGRVLPSLLDAARRGGNLVLHSDGTPRRSFCYVTDFLVSFLRVITRGVNGEAYNVGDDREELSMRELAERVRLVTRAGGRVLVQPSTDPDYLVDNPQRRCPDLGKLRALGGSMPCVSLEEGIARSARWLGTGRSEPTASGPTEPMPAAGPPAAGPAAAQKVAVIGAGRVGLISGLALFELGHQLTLFDVDRSRVARLQAGELPFFEPDAAAALHAATQSARWTVTDRADIIADCDAVVITVPTPAGPDGQYDLDSLRDAVSMLGRVCANAGGGLRWRGIFLRSTVLPGTTHRILAEALASSSADGSLPCPVGHLPEFLREGTALADARRPDRIVVGTEDPDLRLLARALFGGRDTRFFETGVRTAELIKTANNALLSICISFANEIARLSETNGTAGDTMDAMEVFEAIHLDRRFQGTPKAGIVDYLLPGPGFGGSCLGKDLAALAAFARAQQQEPLLLDAALRINRTQPLRFVERIDRAVGGLKGRRVLVLGLAFKPGTDDGRASIALPILRELAGRGATVRVHDPRAAESVDRASLAALGVAVLSDDAFQDAFDAAEAVVLVTAWPAYLQTLPALLAQRSVPLLFADARGVFRKTRRAAGVTYLGVGVPAARDA
jgi:UDPglucose 6-dehydrogenase